MAALLRILGIRHHGPGCARSVLETLEANPPAAVLIEGPPEADELIVSAALEGMTPPVALLIHRADDAKQAVFYPFAEFSPEWQALRWALARGVPVKFMDFPWMHRFALRDVPPIPPVNVEPGAPTAAEDTEPAAEPKPAEAPADAAIRRDPLRVLAEADGYRDSERWWNDRVEERGDPAGMFTAILEAMTAVRTELALPEPLEERQREAWMRRVIRETQRDVLGEIAVVCGAWHAPALAHPPKVSADNELLKGLPKCKVGATWVPWTFQRLCSASGYGAGIDSPGWYEHLWKHRRDPQLTARWLARVGRLLRERDLDASTAQVIDGVRLAEHLAAFRGRAIPGLPEMNEAALAVFCHGDRAPLQLVSRALIVGDRLGTVPEGVARVPLQQDIEATQKRLRLKPAASQTPLELDLREPTGLERSQFLHRLSLLDIPWGHSRPTAAGKGTFRENWLLEWKPEFAVAIVDAARLGNTVELAATGAVAAKSATAALEVLTTLLGSVLLADLPAAATALLQRISAEAARGDDVQRLCLAVPALARLARYGSVRQIDAEAVVAILDGFSARIHAGITGAVSGIDDEAAGNWRKALLDYHAALALLESARLDEWRGVLRKLLDHTGTHALLSGTAARLLLDGGQLAPPEAARTLGLALSRGQDPGRAAAWLEGFLSGQGAVLVHDTHLLPLLEDWVASLTEDAFLAVLPLVRRTFATFESPERARIAQRLGRARSGSGSAGVSLDAEWTLHADRVAATLPVLGQLLGKTFTP
ncbi:MAG: DUF5682 family protein [Verrucomicrobiota bacterium]